MSLRNSCASSLSRAFVSAELDQDQPRSCTKGQPCIRSRRVRRNARTQESAAARLPFAVESPGAEKHTERGHFQQTSEWSEAPEKHKASPGRSARGVQAMPRWAEYLRKREVQKHPALPQHSVCPTQAKVRQSQTETSKKRNRMVHNERTTRRDMTLTRRRREDQTRKTRRTDSTNVLDDGLDERARGRRRLTFAAESVGKRTQASHPALEHWQRPTGRDVAARP